MTSHLKKCAIQVYWKARLLAFQCSVGGGWVGLRGSNLVWYLAQEWVAPGPFTMPTSPKHSPSLCPTTLVQRRNGSTIAAAWCVILTLRGMGVVRDQNVGEEEDFPAPMKSQLSKDTWDNRGMEFTLFGIDSIKNYFDRFYKYVEMTLYILFWRKSNLINSNVKIWTETTMFSHLLAILATPIHLNWVLRSIDANRHHCSWLFHGWASDPDWAFRVFP